MKLRSIIIDDEPLAHEIIEKYSADVTFIEVVKKFHLATGALNYLANNNIDLIFLDIQMPKLKGVDFLKILKNKPLVIITSAHREYALEGFDLDVCDYLLKPFSFERFLKAVNKTYELFMFKNESSDIQSESNKKNKEEQKQLFIKVDKRFIQIDYSDIYYLESYGNFVKVWLKDNFHITARTLTSFENELQKSDFIRIHKSFIINKTHLDYLEGNMIRIKNKKTIPLGKNYRQAFKKYISNPS